MGKGQYTRRKKITMDDIAREAGCSKAAVSYAVNQNHPISKELRRKINAIMERLHYSPAGCSKYTTRREIAILTMDISSWHEASWSQEIRNRGYLPRHYFLVENPKQCMTFLDQINADRNLAGILCLHPEFQSIDLLRHCKNLPSVIFSRENSMLSFATTPYREFGKTAAHALFQFGHRKVGLVYHEKDSGLQKELFESFRTGAAFQELRTITPPPGDPQPEIFFPLLDSAIASGVTAFFAQSIQPFTRCILQWAYQRKLYIPDDFSLLAIDHNQQASHLTPKVSCISWNFEKLIPLTVNSLISRIEGRDPDPIVCEPIITNFGSIGIARES